MEGYRKISLIKVRSKDNDIPDLPFYDLAEVSQNGRHTDINLYINHLPSVRAALRTAKDTNLTDEYWQKLIKIIKKKKM